MFNPVSEAKLELAKLITDAYAAAVAAGELPQAEVPAPVAEIPRDLANGDYATGFAMAAARALRRSPRDIATAIVNHISLEGSIFKSAELAGPGFINFRLGDAWFGGVVDKVLANPAEYGKSNSGAGRTVQVEFVSANPTGPMTIGNARGGVLGDSLASLLECTGWKVTREFYLNDAGNQVMLLGKSLDARYRQLIYGEDAVEFPDDGYHGDDVRITAALYREQNGDSLASMPDEERETTLVAYGLQRNIAQMKVDLERYGIKYDVWFPESDLHSSGYVAETVDIIRKNGYTYEKDGALWFRATDFGLEKDEVLVKANGFYSYYAVDIAYHRNKFVARGFDRVIDVFGADHHGHTLRFRAGLQALGIDPDGLHFVLCQFVRLHKDGELVKVSKRSGKVITLADLLDEVPLDATRFLFNMQSTGAVIEFDMDLAVSTTSDNPVYYVQYAHARICSLLNALAAEGDNVPAAGSIDFSALSNPEEYNLIRTIAQFPEQVQKAANEYEPSHINRYLIDLAGAFHSFYGACRIRGEEDKVRALRLALADAARAVLARGLGLLGVSAPEKM